MADSKPEGLCPSTFTAAARFQDHKPAYGEYSKHLSALDFDGLLRKPNPIRSFDRQFDRSDIFLSKAQVQVIFSKKAEAKAKQIRMQQRKEEQEQKDKDQELEEQGMGDPLGPEKGGLSIATGQTITFSHDDHARVMAMRPFIN